MSQPISHRPRSKAAAVFVVALASLLLAACGGSSKSSTATTASAPSTSSTGKTAPSPSATGQGAGRRAGGRFAAIRACLQKSGITLPERNGAQPGGGPPNGGVGLKLPKGMSRAQFEATVKKCGFSPRNGFAGGLGRFKSPAFKQALAKFAQCMKANGVNVSVPNTSGKGPIFNSKGLDTSSPQFQAAEAKCRSALRGAFRASPGAGAAPGSTSTTG
jgi:hypothetical protein